MNIRYGGRNIKATHVNGALMAKPPRFLEHPILWLHHVFHTYTPLEIAAIAQQEWFHREGSGYAVIQGTKPQTLGYSLTDSPVGLLAWILEKLHDWSDE
jgi:hypothetical protein